ncbi:DUF6907 domain-containing protein [Streptomyces cinereoruber]|uniref:DUF6907 domain-containing protein n=1 Tax=Streptomyces cinereoruber TaxID=67260 RepID=UPI003393F3CA
MSMTVPSSFKPSGGLIQPNIEQPTTRASLALLNGIPAQPKRTTAAKQPRTWSFIDSRDGERMTVTCLPGCQSNHGSDQDKQIHPSDVWCQIRSEDVHVPVNTGKVEDFRLLSVTLNQIPFSSRYAERLPHANVEVIDDHFIENLDPDALQQVINVARDRVAQMETAHSQLVELRNAAMGRTPTRPAPGTFGPEISLTAPGAQGSIVNAALYSTESDPLDTGAPLARIAVWANHGADAELDVAGADQFLADLEKLATQVRSLRNQLAAIEVAR